MQVGELKRMATSLKGTERAGALPLLPATEQLLVAGGDVRIALSSGAGVNKYGCTPFPDGQLAAFGSATASVVSEAGFGAADRLRRHLLGALENASCGDVYAAELERIRGELLSLCGLGHAAEVDVVFAASGTDIHLLASQLVAEAGEERVLAVMVEEGETGSGVPAATVGRHFSSRSALGGRVREGELISARDTLEGAAVALREADGSLRSPAVVDGEFAALVSEAAEGGRPVLLIPADLSKTGCLAPSPELASALQRRYPERVAVLVDACQFRLSPATLRAYLQKGFMVAVTGSKFLTGPSFSGALLIPAALARRWRESARLAPLRSYSARGDWPPGWKAAGVLAETANFGLLLRWEAALAELRAFRQIPESAVGHVLEEIGRAVLERLKTDPTFEELPTPRLDRRPLVAERSWDHRQTIFPFLLHRPDGTGGRNLLSRTETAEIYDLLPLALTDFPASESGGARGDLGLFRCQLGQPVACGNRGGVPVSALRLCLSSRLVVEAVKGGGGVAAVTEKALRALDKAAALARSRPVGKQMPSP